MGCSLSTLYDDVFGPPKVTGFVGGLELSGKTSILCFQQNGTPMEPPIGYVPLDFRIETVRRPAFTFLMYDYRMCSFARNRAFYRHISRLSDICIYVVESTNVADLPRTREDLERFLEYTQTPSTPVLIYFNKQDVAGALTPQELSQALGLFDSIGSGPAAQLATRPWKVQPCSALTGEGINEGLDWLCDQLLHTIFPVEEDAKYSA